MNIFIIFQIIFVVFNIIWLLNQMNKLHKIYIGYIPIYIPLLGIYLLIVLDKLFCSYLYKNKLLRSISLTTNHKDRIYELFGYYF